MIQFPVKEDLILLLQKSQPSTCCGLQKCQLPTLNPLQLVRDQKLFLILG